MKKHVSRIFVATGTRNRVEFARLVLLDRFGQA